MKAKILNIILLIMFVPSIAMAAWWNPLSWLQQPIKKDVQESLGNATTTTYRYYVKARSNVRACAGPGCIVVNQFNQGEYLDFTFSSGFSSLTMMPEWVGVSWKDGGVLKYGYINRGLLSEEFVSPAQTSLKVGGKLDDHSTIGGIQPVSSANDDWTLEQREKIDQMNKIIDKMKIMIEERDAKKTSAQVPNYSTSAQREAFSGEEYWSCQAKYKNQRASAKLKTDTLNQEKKALEDSVGGTNAAIEKSFKDREFMNKMSVISSQINEAMRSETDLLRSEMLDCSKYAPAYTSPSIYPTSDTYSSPGNVNMQSGYDSLPTKESCYSSYDPVSGILRLQGCKSW